MTAARSKYANPSPRPDEWLTREQLLAVRPFIVERTLKTWCDRGILPYSKLTNGQTAPRLYRLADVDALIAALAVPATSGPLAKRKAS